MIEQDVDPHTYVCAQFPAKDAPPQEWVDHYLWAADVYAARGMNHFVESMRFRAKLWQRSCTPEHGNQATTWRTR